MTEAKANKNTVKTMPKASDNKNNKFVKRFEEEMTLILRFVGPKTFSYEPRTSTAHSGEATTRFTKLEKPKTCSIEAATLFYQL